MKTPTHIQRLQVAANKDFNGTANSLNAALREACKKGNEEVVNHLIAAKVDVNAEHSDGSTALIVACRAGHQTIVEKLVQAGADINVMNNKGHTPFTDDGFTPLMMACAGGHEAVVDKLMQAGADINATSIDGHTPFMCAISNGHGAVAGKLIKAGSNSHTALMEACKKGNEKTVKRLKGVILKLRAAMESTSKRKRDQDDEAIGTEKSAKTLKKPGIASRSIEDSNSAPAAALQFFPDYSDAESSQDESPTVPPVLSPS